MQWRRREGLDGKKTKGHVLEKKKRNGARASTKEESEKRSPREEPLARDAAPVTLANPIKVPHIEVLQHRWKEPSLESCFLGDLPRCCRDHRYTATVCGIKAFPHHQAAILPSHLAAKNHLGDLSSLALPHRGGFPAKELVPRSDKAWPLRDEAWCRLTNSEGVPLLQRSFEATCLESRSSPPWRGGGVTAKRRCCHPQPWILDEDPKFPLARVMWNL